VKNQVGLGLYLDFDLQWTLRLIQYWKILALSGIIIVNIRIKICLYRLSLLSVNRILEYIRV
jgi:hypothetical protein